MCFDAHANAGRFISRNENDAFDLENSLHLFKGSYLHPTAIGFKALDR